MRVEKTNKFSGGGVRVLRLLNAVGEGISPTAECKNLTYSPLFQKRGERNE